MQCPLCDSYLKLSVLKSGHITRECPNEHGRWIPSFQFWQWLVENGKKLPSDPKSRVVSESQGDEDCPECGGTLISSNAGRGLAFPIEHCSSCWGLWIRQETWEKLSPKNPVEDVVSIYKTLWRRMEARLKSDSHKAVPTYGAGHYNEISKRKPFYPISQGLQAYLEEFGRASPLPHIYQDLLSFENAIPCPDKDENDTFWETVFYNPLKHQEFNHKLSRIYSQLKTGDPEMIEHIYIERIDFCEFANSRPFRIRVVNQFNDNHDHFYVKTADASRIYGLELEHTLSPNRINYMVEGGTLIEEHIAGIPGDVFIRDHQHTLNRRNKVRIAKEFVKFNERSFARLLGDMRSYNYVVDMTPDFEEVQYRVRAIDFDQQSYEGNFRIYLPQFFKENAEIVAMCTDLLNYPTMKQYQTEEQTLISRRVKVARRRLDALFAAMRADELSSPDKIEELGDGLNAYHDTSEFTGCKNMGDLVWKNIQVSIRGV